MIKREVINVPNAPKHGDNPIPVCVMMGNQIFPSVINGRDPKEPGVSEDPKKQIAQAFINMKNIIEAAGGTTDSIAKVITSLMGNRVSLSYEEKRGIPTSCFGETDYFVNGVRKVE